MSRVFPVRYAAPAWQLGLLAGTNLLAAVAGGRVLSSVKGLFPLSVLGSGPALALLSASALGLGLLTAIRHFQPSRVLVVLALASIISSAWLLAIYTGVSIPQSCGEGRLASGASSCSSAFSTDAALLYFLVLVIRCALWLAGRALRSDIAGTCQPSWLGFTEAAYFFGFVIGLGWGSLGIMDALHLDLVLLCVVLGADLILSLTVSSRQAVATPAPPARDAGAAYMSFWRLTAAFAALAIACQVVTLHLADTFARRDVPLYSLRGDEVMISFYLGVAVAATFCSWVNPVLDSNGQHTTIRIYLRRRELAIPVGLLVGLTGSLFLGGLSGTLALTGGGTRPTFWLGIEIFVLVALGVGAALFELLVIALVRQIAKAGRGKVALALGLVGMAAASALFLMLLLGMQLLGWITITTIGLALAFWLMKGDIATSKATSHLHLPISKRRKPLASDMGMSRPPSVS